LQHLGDGATTILAQAVRGGLSWTKQQLDAKRKRKNKILATRNNKGRQDKEREREGIGKTE